MLVGVGGSGKQSLTRMACALSDSKCFQIELTRGYGLNEFREDIKVCGGGLVLKVLSHSGLLTVDPGCVAPPLPVSVQKIMLQSGVAGKQVVFLFTDTQIVNESLLEDINNVLNTGEVPNLWEVDEVNKIIEDLRPVCVAQVRCHRLCLVPGCMLCGAWHPLGHLVVLT
jgi:dynein heavy chain